MMYVDFSAGNKEYKLRLNTRSLLALEKRLGMNPLSIFGTDEKDYVIPTLEHQMFILHASLQQYNHGITLEDTYEIFDNYLEDGHSMDEFLFVIMDVYRVSGLFKDKKVEGEDDSKNA